MRIPAVLPFLSSDRLPTEPLDLEDTTVTQMTIKHVCERILAGFGRIDQATEIADFLDRADSYAVFYCPGILDLIGKTREYCREHHLTVI